MPSSVKNEFTYIFSDEIEDLKKANSKAEYLSLACSIERKLLQYDALPAAHELLGETIKQLVECKTAPEEFAEICRTVPKAYSSELICGRFYELEGNGETAFKYYIRALKNANSKGFWLSTASSAPWIRPFVRHAIEFAERARRQQSREWISQLCSTYPKDELERVIDGIYMFTGEQEKVIPNSHQDPAFFYVPNLPSTPVFERKNMPFLENYEARADLILNELQEVLGNNKEIPNFKHTDDEGSLTDGGDWNAYFFYRHGEEYKENLVECPETGKALDELPLCKIQGQSPEVCFSILRPKTRIKPHRGVTNMRSVSHLGLVTPENCGLHIIDEKKLDWSCGKAFAFDDTFWHEAWNNSDRTRVVLLADVWNPNLTCVERAALTDLVPMISATSKL